MFMLVVMMPFLNFALFLLFGRLVNKNVLAGYTIASMGSALVYLATSYKQVVLGAVSTTALGT